VPIKDEPSVVLSGVVVGQDVTELRLTDAELACFACSEQRLRVQAEEANRLKDEFLAVISHELRTPLNAIVGWTTILRSGKADQQLFDKGLEVIQRNALLQNRMIEELLDVSRTIAGKIVLDNKLLEMASIIGDAVNSIRPVADAKHITISTEIHPDVGRLSGDADRLQQIVGNLLSNSVKFTPDGGHISVIAGRVGDEIELLVRDSGSGIEPAFLPHVFERFRQAESTRRSGGGLGLGLAIVRHLVELHGGSITAHSEGIGLGAVFTVRFPSAEVDGYENSQPPPLSQHVENYRIASVGRRCLSHGSEK
jgi:signal transduction histidine kinase